MNTPSTVRTIFRLPFVLLLAFLIFHNEGVSAGRAYEVGGKGHESLRRQIAIDAEYRRTHGGRSPIEEQFYQMRISDVKRSVADKNNLRSYVLSDPGLAGISVRLPREELKAHDGFVIETARKALELLINPLNLESVYVLNVADDIGSRAEYAASIPEAIKRRTQPMKNVFLDETKDRSLLFREVEALPLGATILIIGHINEGHGTLVVERQRSVVEISVMRLQQLAAASHINLIVIGCNSSSVATIGTTQLVDSVEFLRQVGVFFHARTSTATTSLGELYVATAKAAGGLLIDPFEFKLDGAIPIMDASGHVSSISYNHFSSPCRRVNVPYNPPLSPGGHALHQLGLSDYLTAEQLEAYRPYCVP